MSRMPKDCFSWSLKRFWVTVLVLFVVQVGLIALFSDRTGARTFVSSPPIHFRALGAVSEDQLLREFFVGDPAVFPLLNPRGFSGRGWMDQKPLIYQALIDLKPPIWLNLDTSLLQMQFGPSMIPASLPRFLASVVSSLGTNFPSEPSTEPFFSTLAEREIPREEPSPVFLTPETIPTRSIFRLGGGLSNRLLGGAPALRNWPSDKLLNSSIVQIAVNPLGEVISARLETSCGSVEADTDAVNAARALRFRPAREAGTKWGEAVFQWQTTEPGAATPPK
jgi:TonB family protein